jgi:hypothetical protein
LADELRPPWEGLARPEQGANCVTFRFI